MTSDRRPPPTLTEAELPAVSPLEFVVGVDDGSLPALDVRESEFEQGYNLRDAYSCSMFIALCRRDGLMVYRRPRQRTVTVCVKTTVSKHNALWAHFLRLSAYSDVIRSAFRRHSISVPKVSDQDSGAFDQRFRSFDHPFRPSAQGRPSG